MLASQGARYLNLALTREDKLIAFAITQVVLDEATLFNLAVDPDFQRQGLGEQLLTGLIAHLVERGVQMLWLEVRASNHAAISLYEKLCFNEVSRRRDYYPAPGGKKEDAIVMALML
ncbi:MAG: Ribosomal-protein-alanine acetyltransferase [Candidatus Erwinia impunctatus]|nr:Ribosomal-protein-alanine acetyltransferase [Culicoides impunctatus]